MELIFKDWIYISPHLDDAALSLGGLIWEQSQAGLKVSVWTICSGDPPPGELSPFADSLHKRWGAGHDAMEARRTEDINSCTRLGAEHRHFSVPDCIYRRSLVTGEHLYTSEEALWSSIHPDEDVLVEEISEKLAEKMPNNACVVSPLGLGNHVDHCLARAAVKSAVGRMDKDRIQRQFFYAEYPYVLEETFPTDQGDIKPNIFTISPKGILAWQESIAAHQSQISTFWGSKDEMRSAIQSFYDQFKGVWLGEFAD